MPHFLNPQIWYANWTKRHNLEPSQPPCSLVSCTRSQSYWQRLRDRHRPNGTVLQGAFYCQPQCLETALINQLSRLRLMVPAPQPPNRIPLGLLMVARGKLTHDEVRAALEAQRRARYGKIGEWIEKLGFATEQEVTTALALQWGCPVATSFDPSTVQSLGNIPLPILEAFQMLPINYASPPTPSTSLSENAWITPLSMPSKKFSFATLSPASPDAKLSPANSSSCANCHVPPTWNSAP